MEIDKTRGARLRTIALHEGITQTKLSEMIDCSPVHLSKIINGSRNLTEEMAQKVVSLFPEYRLPWLLGYDDYMTEEDALRGPLKRIAQRMVGWKVAVEYTLQSMGYTVRLNGADYLDTVDDILGGMENVSYAIVDENNEVCAECGAEADNALLQEIGDFAEFLIERRFHLEGKRG